MTAIAGAPASPHRVADRGRAVLSRAVTIAVVAVLSVVGAGSGADAGTSSTWMSPLLPLQVVRGFDPPDGPYAPGHRGVDLGGRMDQPVRSAATGVVTFSGQVGGLGIVVVSHGRIRTTYQPLWGVLPPVGTALRGGDAVGRLAPVGSHCSPAVCLHWGAVLDETYVDPLTLLDPGPSRLLPYWDVDDRSVMTEAMGSVGQHGSAAPGGGDRSGGASASTPAVEAPSRSAGWPPDGASWSPVGSAVGAEARRPSAAMIEQRQPVSAGVAVVIAVVGGAVAGAVLLAIRRRRE